MIVRRHSEGENCFSRPQRGACPPLACVKLSDFLTVQRRFCFTRGAFPDLYCRQSRLFLRLLTARIYMATLANRKHDKTLPAIPDRLYFKIGDVARLCGVETYVLRFWESQFPQLKPNKSGTGQRLYRRRDVELALEIKRLVHNEGYTLAGARTVLEQNQKRPGPQRTTQTDLPLALGGDEKLDLAAAAIDHARIELREIAGQLASSVPAPQRRRSRLTTIRPKTGMLFPSETD